MKHFVSLFLLALVAVLIFPVGLLAQAVDTTGLANNPVFDAPTLDSLLSGYEILYGALVIVWGYIAKAFKLNAKVNNFVFVVLAGGIILAGAFIIFGVAKALPLMFAFLSAIGLYDVIFKPLAGLFGAKK